MMRFVSLCLALFALNGPISISAQAGMIDLQKIEIQVLDKSTARTTTLKANVGETIKYQSLFIKVQACRKSEPLDKPEDAAFLQIWEIPVGKQKSEWAFSGWMFSSSPALSAMDHAMYDVWVLNCSSNAKPEINTADPEVGNKDVMNNDTNDSEKQEELDQVSELIDPSSTTRIEAESFDNVINELSE